MASIDKQGLFKRTYQQTKKNVASLKRRKHGLEIPIHKTKYKKGYTMPFKSNGMHCNTLLLINGTLYINHIAIACDPCRQGDG